MYFVFTSTEHIRELTHHFENLIRAARVQPNEMADHLRRTQEMARQKKFVPHHSEKKPKAPKGDPGEVA